MPTDKEIGVVHGRIFRKPRSNAKAFKTIRHSTRRKERQLHGGWKVTQQHDAVYRSSK